MRLNRKQSLAVALGSIVLFFVVGGLFLNSDRKLIVSSRPATPIPVHSPVAASVSSTQLASSVQTPSQASQFTMNEFHRSETKNGRTVWEVHGSRGEYFPQTNSAKIQDAKLTMYDKDGKASDLQTKEAEIYLSGPSLGRAHGRAGVQVVYHGDTTLTTEEADYDRSKGTLSTAGPVKIVGSRVDITGNKLEGNVDSQIFTLTGDVVTIIKPKVKG